MVEIGRHIRLVWQYGKWIIVLGGLFNVVCAGFLVGAFSYAALVYALILKVMFTSVVLYLHRAFESRDAVFFYINLGLSRKRLLGESLAFDFGVCVLLEMLIAVCR